ncbi:MULTISPECIES: NUDIX hydrolase [Spirosoma]|uniref:NUDIX domain-containing protein n=1 Tax=Spirosoma sordidisoli TaxID=2502893 RepID=A0A4Q2UCA0_9BACT|nr:MULTISPECIES: NUDIX hydrolase [Spirosoma]RYC66386.1 NUDIX domain-containing protein [Spirosoma sordidisoli]
MHREPLLNLLRQYRPADPEEQTMTARTIDFVEKNPACFERSLPDGHITGSAWVVEQKAGQGQPAISRVVLIHHRKLDRWLQPGGHADGDPDVAAVALREAQEETGLNNLKLVGHADGSPAIFDVDIHTIPARGDVPEHLHYDIRFLVEADPEEAFRANHETKDIQWFSLEKAESLTKDASIFRMLRKNWL